jgi:hypothetical protein
MLLNAVQVCSSMLLNAVQCSSVLLNAVCSWLKSDYTAQDYTAQGILVDSHCSSSNVAVQDHTNYSIKKKGGEVHHYWLQLFIFRHDGILSQLLSQFMFSIQYCIQFFE